MKDTRTSKVSLICPRCHTISEALIISSESEGMVKFQYDKNHVVVKHGSIVGTLKLDPECAHCPDPLTLDDEHYSYAYMIWADHLLGPIIKDFLDLGVITQWSCEGHFNITSFNEDGTAYIEEYSLPYLFFSPGQGDTTLRLYEAAATVLERRSHAESYKETVECVLSRYDPVHGFRWNYSYDELIARLKYAPATKNDIVLDVSTRLDPWSQPLDELNTTLKNLTRNKHTMSEVKFDENRRHALNVFTIKMRDLQREYIEFLKLLIAEYKYRMSINFKNINLRRHIFNDRQH